MYWPNDILTTRRRTSLGVAPRARRSASSSAIVLNSDTHDPMERVLVVIGSERTGAHCLEFARLFADRGGAEIRALQPNVADPASEVRRAALTLGADWLCMVVHGGPGLMTVFLNSEDEEILRRAPCPVVCLPEAELARTVLRPVKRILVATNNPTGNHDMMLSAVGLAECFTAKIDLLGVEEVVRQPVGSPALKHGGGIRKGRRLAIRDGLAQLRGSVVPQRRRGRLKVSLGLPLFYATIQAARELQSDLIMLSVPTRRWQANSRIDIGTERILRTATCPVICVPERDGRADVIPDGSSSATLLRNAEAFRARRESAGRVDLAEERVNENNFDDYYESEITGSR